jgi:hypothetical protein
MDRSQVFRWARRHAWRAEVRAMVAEAAGHACGVLPAAVPGEGAADERLEVLVRRFSARYAAVEAFHAGRPDDPSSYGVHGILPHSSAPLCAEAAERFCGGPRARVDRECFDRVLSRQDLSAGEGEAGFCLDERYVHQCDSFYLVYGSHFLFGLAIQLGRVSGVDLKSLLRARGVPTLVTCHVPIDRVSAPALRLICLRAAQSACGEPRSRERSSPIRLDFTVPGGLGPGHVARIRHPVSAVDHLYGFREPATAGNRFVAGNGISRAPAGRLPCPAHPRSPP